VEAAVVFTAVEAWGVSAGAVCGVTEAAEESGAAAGFVVTGFSDCVSAVFDSSGGTLASGEELVSHPVCRERIRNAIRISGVEIRLFNMQFDLPWR